MNESSYIVASISAATPAASRALSAVGLTSAAPLGEGGLGGGLGATFLTTPPPVLPPPVLNGLLVPLASSLAPWSIGGGLGGVGGEGEGG